ncbi:E3 ubiquitin-protein ligase [Canna indica]|uniref:RING-type E3 ubiquitin transferase n=1 Tax=Canna indica TaxID=4628 RepID=A0AAQ3Q5Q6_9LILI|nr:E3 ubiquitin-protein ligase [Canna indica]
MVCICCCFRSDDSEEQEHPTGRCICFQQLTRIIGHMTRGAGLAIFYICHFGLRTYLGTNCRKEYQYRSLFQRRERERVAPSGEQSLCQDNRYMLQRGKDPIPLHGKSQLLRDEKIELMGRKENLNESKSEGGSRTTYSEISAASKDEDLCPICLEEYTFENPRISLQCTHQYHLSCVYEWMERSKNCPMCYQIMFFSEET